MDLTRRHVLTLGGAALGGAALPDRARAQVQLVLKSLKDVGIDAKLETKEYGAYIATCFNGNFPSMAYGPQTPFLEPDNFLFAQYYPGAGDSPLPRAQSHRRRACVSPTDRKSVV